MRINWKFLSLLLMVVGLVLVALPCQILAQANKAELTLRLLPGYYYSEVTPGESKTLYLEIENSGDEAITNIELFSDKPKGWTVDFAPESIDYLAADSHQSIGVHVVAGKNTIKDDYTLTLIAEADQTRAVTSTILRVEDAFSPWRWIGLGVGALVIVLFVFLYRRFGRE
ncbi:MAG: hypothetical protein J7L19_06225 [Dehalococcoidia bacterium]|nr:hypothetical protein [Dehalococcoidia bacterium]